MYSHKTIFIKPNVNKVIIYSSVIVMSKVLLHLPLQKCINTCKSQYANLHYRKKIKLKLLQKSLFLKSSKMQQLTVFSFLNSLVNIPQLTKDFHGFHLFHICWKYVQKVPVQLILLTFFFSFCLIAWLQGKVNILFTNANPITETKGQQLKDRPKKSALEVYIHQYYLFS